MIKLKSRTVMVKIWSVLRGAVIFSLVTGFFVTEGSALVIKKSVQELTYEADAILIGEVKDIESRWNKERTLIYTYVTISVRKYTKALPNMKEVEKITVKVPGGEVGDIGLKISDTPEFREGEEVFLFLRIEELPIFRIAGLFQGKYTIEDGKAKNEVLEREISLDIFIDQIEEIMKKAKASE